MRRLWIGPLLALAAVAVLASPSSAHTSRQVIPRSTSVARNAATEQRNSVFRLYWAYFLRNPDDSGIAYWVGRLDQGTTLATVSNSFAGSSEFKHRYGQLSNRDFVNLIYSNVFSRAVDAGGLAYWTSKLDGGTSRGSVMLGFSQSNEFRRITNTGPGLCDTTHECTSTLINYWATGGQHARTLAGFIASPSAVSYLFGLPYSSSAGWAYSGCSAGVCRVNSSDGRVLRLTMAGTSPPYSISSVSLTGSTDTRCSTPEKCSRTLFGYWITGDRTHAKQIASAYVVSQLFAVTYDNSLGWAFKSCHSSANAVDCSATNNLGWTLTFGMANVGPPFSIGSVTYTP